MNQHLVAEGQYLAIFHSTHRVLQAEGLLKDAGQTIMLIPAPRTIQADCGLAIRFDQEQYDTVVGLLHREGLLPVYVSQLHNGQYHTVQEFQNEDH